MIDLKTILYLLLFNLFGLFSSCQTPACDFSDRLKECEGEVAPGFSGDCALSEHSLKEFKNRLIKAKSSNEIIAPHLGLFARSNVSLSVFLERYNYASRFFSKGEFGHGISDAYWGHYAISDLNENEFKDKLKEGEKVNIEGSALGEFVLSGLDESTFLDRYEEARKSGLSGRTSAKYAASKCSL
jgi:hypothetical protein